MFQPERHLEIRCNFLLHLCFWEISLKKRNTLLLFSSIHQSANLNFDIYFKQRPKLSEQSLPHQWRFIYNWNNLRLQNVQNSESESQKVKVATFTRKWKWPLSPRNTWRIYCEKKSTGSSSSHLPLRPLLFSSLAPSASLLRPERPPHSALLSSCCSGERLSSQLVNIGLREWGSSSEMLLMATWSKKILVLGWAPPYADAPHNPCLKNIQIMPLCMISS